MENHSTYCCLPGNYSQMLFFKICFLLDFGQPQTSWPLQSQSQPPCPASLSLSQSLNLSLSLSLPLTRAPVDSAALTHHADSSAVQHHPALYGVFSVPEAMSINSFLQPVAIEFLPWARHCFIY